MNNFNLAPQQIEDYQENGYIIIPNFLSVEETLKLYSIAIEDEVMRENAYDLNDQSGKKTKLSIWYTPGDDVYGLLTRSQRLVKTADQLLDKGGKVCHFHSKLMQKEPKVGGAWEWHQDYGYWYQNEFLFPNQMYSTMIAITDATKENGCLQVLKKSHTLGRIEHFYTGEQRGADIYFVNLALKRFELVYVELKAGDALFFHSNLLHTSATNESDTARWSLISCYNREHNIGYNEPSGKACVPINEVPNEAMLEWETAGLDSEANSFKQKAK